MRVKIIHDNQVTVIENFDQVIVEDSKGDPVAIAGKYGTDVTYLVSAVDSPGFNQALHDLGLNRSVIVTSLNLHDPIALPRIF